MNYNKYKNEKFVCQDCGHDRFAWYTDADLISCCMKCGFRYQLQFVTQKVPMVVVNPESSVTLFTTKRAFVTRYVTRRVQRWVPITAPFYTRGH